MMRSKMAALFLLLAWFLTPFWLNSGFCQQAEVEDPRSVPEKQEAATQTLAGQHSSAKLYSDHFDLLYLEQCLP